MEQFDEIETRAPRRSITRRVHRAAQNGFDALPFTGGGEDSVSHAINARADRLDLEAIADRVEDIANRADHIRLPSAINPHAFHEDIIEFRASLRIIARQLRGK